MTNRSDKATAEPTPHPTDLCCLCGTTGRFKGDSDNSRIEPCPLRCGWVAVADQRYADLYDAGILAALRWNEQQIAERLRHLANPLRIRNADTNEHSLGALIGSLFGWMAAMDRAVNA
jgi:hypothetical protein